jgi:hypothetical protein
LPRRPVFLQSFGEALEFTAQPLERLPAQPCPVFAADLVCIVTLPGGDQRHDAGAVVAVHATEVLA